MKLHKIYVHNDNIATFLCPCCERVKTFDITRYQDVGCTLHVDYQCECGKKYTIRVERRRFYRKDVKLKGFFSIGDEFTKRPMIVHDLSRSGMKLELHENANIDQGDKLFIDFTLDNEQQMRIRREVVVRSISGMMLGVEFASRDPNNPFDKIFDMAIGNYTFSR